MSTDWSFSDEELAALTVPTSPPGAYEAQALEIFRRNAVAIAGQIVDIALNAENDKVRLDAGKYVVDRVLGRIGEATNPGAERPMWENVYGTVLREPSKHELTGPPVGEEDISNENQ